MNPGNTNFKNLAYVTEAQARRALTDFDAADEPDEPGPDYSDERWYEIPAGADIERVMVATVGGEENAYVVEKIVEHRVTASGDAEYKVRWAGHGEASDTWERHELMEQRLMAFGQLVTDYMRPIARQKAEEQRRQKEEEEEEEQQQQQGAKGDTAGEGPEPANEETDNKEGGTTCLPEPLQAAHAEQRPWLAVCHQGGPGGL